MDIGWKIVSAGAGIVSGIVANKLVDVAWTRIAGRERPEADDYTEPFRDAVVFGIVSSAVGVVVHELVVRRAAKWYGLGSTVDRAAKARIS